MMWSSLYVALVGFIDFTPVHDVVVRKTGTMLMVLTMTWESSCSSGAKLLEPLMYRICLPCGTRLLHITVGAAGSLGAFDGGAGGALIIAPSSNLVVNVRQLPTGSLPPAIALVLQAFRNCVWIVGIVGGSTRKHMFGCNRDGTHNPFWQSG